MYKRKRQVPDPVGGLEYLPISLMKIFNYSTAGGVTPNQVDCLLTVWDYGLSNLAAGVPLKGLRIAAIGGLSGLA